MTKYSKRFMASVARYEKCNTAASLLLRSEVGLKQFFDYESRGIVPDQPDPYFVFLLDGKKWWEWTLNSYASQYRTFEWPGWLMLAEDFKDDPDGFKQLRQRVGATPS